MFTRKKALVFLILVMILLSGCSGKTLYPKDKIAMKKLFEENAGEFQKFADNLFLQVKGTDLLEIVYVPPANLGNDYGYKIRKGATETELASISKLQNGKEISDFIKKYGVFTAVAGGLEGEVTFHLFPIQIAKTSGQGSGYKPEQWKDVRQYSYEPNETKEQIERKRATEMIELQEHWYASIPMENASESTFPTIVEIKSLLVAEGYKEINPIITSVSLPFLADKEKVSNNVNSYADYIFEIDDSTLAFFFEREKKVSVVLFNWKNEKIVQRYEFLAAAFLSGNYHVERVSIDLFAYACATAAGEPEFINILRIDSDGITEAGQVALPTDVKFTKGTVGISANMKQIALARSEPARLTLGELDDSLLIHTTGELNAVSMVVNEKASIDKVKFISEDVVAYSWTGSNTEDATRNSGIGLYSLVTEKILLDYPFTKDTFLLVKDGIVLDNSDIKVTELNDLLRFITTSEVHTFGNELFFAKWNSIICSSLSDQIFASVRGTSKHLENKCYVRYSLTKKEWDQELWNIPDPVVLLNIPPTTRSIYITTASMHEARFYIIALDDQKPILNIVQHPNP